MAPEGASGTKVKILKQLTQIIDCKENEFGHSLEVQKYFSSDLNVGRIEKHFRSLLWSREGNCTGFCY